MTQNLLETGSFLAFEWLILIFDNFMHLCREFHSCVIVRFKKWVAPIPTAEFLNLGVPFSSHEET